MKWKIYIDYNSGEEVQMLECPHCGRMMRLGVIIPCFCPYCLKEMEDVDYEISNTNVFESE